MEYNKTKYLNLLSEQFKTKEEIISDTIKQLSIDKIHVLGDLFDKGNYADKIIERFMQLPNVDIQWGNHDIVWMGHHVAMKFV